MSTSRKKILLLTVREVSELLRIRRAKVYELIADGTIHGFKLGGDWRVRRKSIEQIIGPIPEGYFVREEQEQSLSI